MLSGLISYYYNYVNKPKYYLSRWVYIIRYSCFKTFAQKFKSSIKKILKKYIVHSTYKIKYKLNTIQYSNSEKIGKKTFTRTWTLKTLDELLFELQ